MRALLMKDCFVLWKQLRLYVVLMLIFTVVNGAFGNVFIVIWAAMLPYTAMAYDERSKWDQMAAMMPYSIRDIVLSKYLLGWVCSVAAGLCSMALQFVLTVLDVPTAALDPVANLIGLWRGARPTGDVSADLPGVRRRWGTGHHHSGGGPYRQRHQRPLRLLHADPARSRSGTHGHLHSPLRQDVSKENHLRGRTR